MNPKHRFLFGGIGALMPVLLTVISLDLAVAFSNEAAFTTANIIGIAIRYAGLFCIGGFIAYLHDDERKPFKLFEIGVAAPALITSLVAANAVQNANGSNMNGASAEAWFIPSAIAAERPDQPPQAPIRSAGGFFGDVGRGLTGSVYQEQRRVTQPTATSRELERAGQSADSQGVWKKPPSAGAIPPGALEAVDRGDKQPGQASYLCRTTVRDEVLFGRVASNHAGCTIATRAGERTSREYEVLVLQPENARPR
jgi:hypothetical protein